MSCLNSLTVSLRLCCVFLLVITCSANSQEFDRDNYEIYIGDANGDGIDDLYLHFPDQFAFIHGSILTPILLPEESPDLIVYSYEGPLSYYLDPQPVSQLDLSQFTQYTGAVTLEDVNGDGIVDLAVNEFGIGGNGVILLAGEQLAVYRQPSNTENLAGIAEPTIDTGATNPANDSLTGADYYGVLEGEYNVGNDGSFNYTLPIMVPPGINGAQPSISLSYNSNRKNSIAGYGWAIDGYSMVHRCNASVARDGHHAGINPGEDYRYCVDGQRLVEVAEGEYRFEMERYARIKRYGEDERTPEYWTVETADGSKMMFGNTADASSADASFPDANGDAIAWYLSRSQDIHGNAITYQYDKNVEAGTHRIASISYGGTELNHSVEFNYQTRPDQSLRYQAGQKMVSDKRLSEIVVKANGSEVRNYSLNYRVPGQNYDGVEHDDINQLSLLDSIDLCFGQSQVICAESLEFGWDNTQIQLFNGTQQQFEKTGLVVDPRESYGDRLHHPVPQAVGYFDSDFGKDGLQIKYSGQITQANHTRTGFDYWHLDKVNILYSNGNVKELSDKMARYIYAEELLCNSVWEIHEKGGARTEISGPSGCWYPNAQAYRDNQVGYKGYHSGTLFSVDLNGDGKDDLLNIMNYNGYDQYIHAALISTDNGFVYNDNYTLKANPEPFPFTKRLDYNYSFNGGNSQIFNFPDPYRFQFVDMNGDGLVDVLRVPPVTPSFLNFPETKITDVSVALNTGAGFGAFTKWMDAEELSDLYGHVTYGDVNGDGLLDIISVTGAVVLNVNGSHFRPAPEWRIFGRNYGRYSKASGFDIDQPYYSTKRSFFVKDVNGDGMDDYVYVQKQGIPLREDAEGPYYHNWNFFYGDRCAHYQDGPEENCNRLYVEVALSTGIGFSDLEPKIEYEYPLDPSESFISGATFLTGGGSFDFQDLNNDGNLDLIFYANQYDSADSINLDTDHWFAAFRDNYWTMPQLGFTVVYSDGSGGFSDPQHLFGYECLGSIVEGWENNRHPYIMLDTCGVSHKYELPSARDHKIVKPYQPFISQINDSRIIKINYEVLDSSNVDAPYRVFPDSKFYMSDELELGGGVPTNFKLQGMNSGFFNDGQLGFGAANVSGRVSQTIINGNQNFYAVKELKIYDNKVLNFSRDIRRLYSYTNARRSVTGFGSLGFETRTVKEYQPLCGYIENITEYYQEIDRFFKFSGVEKKSQTYTEECYWDDDDFEYKLDGDRALIFESKSRWAINVFENDLDAYQSPHYFPFLLEQSVEEFSLSGLRKKSRQRTVYFNNGVTNTCSALNDNAIGRLETRETLGLEINAYVFGLPSYVENSVCDGEASSAYSQTMQNQNIGSIVTDEKWVVGLIGTEKSSAWQGERISLKRNNLGVTRTMSHEYNSNGLRTATTLEPNDDSGLYFKTTLDYDQYGYVSSMTETVKDNSATNFDSRTTSINTTFQAGVRKEVVTNPLGHTMAMEYEPSFGLPTLVRDFNGLTTTTQYDLLGRETHINSPSGNTYINYKSCENCFGYSIFEKYYVNMKVDGNAPMRIYYDVHGQDIGSRAKSLTNDFVYTAKNYDPKGNTVSETAPFIAGDTQYVTEIEYDILNRPTQTNYADGTTSRVIYDSPVANAMRATNQENQSKVTYTNPLGWVTRVVDPLTTVSYTYNAFGDMTSTTVDNNSDTKVTIDYDLLGRRISMSDPNTGLNLYEYNGFGHTVSETDGNGIVTNYTYDELDRQLTRTDDAEGQSVVHRWYYDTAPRGSAPNTVAIGLLAGVSGKNTDGSDYYEHLTYTQNALPKTMTKLILGQEYTFTNYYDQYDRQVGYEYPSGFALQYSYNNLGYMSQVSSANTGQRLWQASNDDAFGNITEYQLGNTATADARVINVSKTYDPIYGRVNQISATRDSQVLQEHAYQYSALGNLTRRTDAKNGFSQCFSYDRLNRLTHSGFGSVSSCNPSPRYSYNDLGNIITKEGVIGNYQYGENGAGPNAVTSVNGLAYVYDNAGNFIAANDETGPVKTAEYNVFNKPSRLSGNGNSAEFVYNSDGDRIFQQDSKGRATTYVSLGDYEIVQNGSVLEYIHYLDDWGTYTVNTAANDDYFQYTLRDHIGSVVAKVGETGDIEKLSNDPWGQRVEEQWDGITLDEGFEPLGSARGYTDHEHLDGVGLIHMNGRVYDPLLGRFLSPDPFVQAPYNTQSYNRYSYVFNNPLSFTDPSGYTCQSSGNGEGQTTGESLFGPTEELVDLNGGGGSSGCDGFTGALTRFLAGNMFGGYLGGYPDLFEYLSDSAGETLSQPINPSLAYFLTNSGPYPSGPCAMSQGECTVGDVALGSLPFFFGFLNKTTKLGKAADEVRVPLRRNGPRNVESGNTSKELTSFYPTNDGFIGPRVKTTLLPGQTIDRFGGSDISRFFSPAGTPAQLRALPPGTTNTPLRTFEVAKPMNVEAGRVAPAFNQIGLGEQYRSDLELGELLIQGILKEL